MPKSLIGDAERLEFTMQRLDRLLDQAERIAFASEHKRPAEAVRALSAAARIASELQLARIAMDQIADLRERVEAMRDDCGPKQAGTQFERPEGDVIGLSVVSGKPVKLPNFGYPSVHQNGGAGNDE